MAATSAIVTRPFSQLENRCLRAHPHAPVSSIGGASWRRSPTGRASVMAQRSLKAMRLLYQFMNAEIDRLTDR